MTSVSIQTAPIASVVNMPLPGEPTAPHFGGRSTDIERFLKHYDRLLARNNVTDPIAQCEEIIQYCSPRVPQGRAPPVVQPRAPCGTPRCPHARAPGVSHADLHYRAVEALLPFLLRHCRRASQHAGAVHQRLPAVFLARLFAAMGDG
ncbi:hypothetical protein B0H19DRAFT_1180310 [Mycena capillaripes]|nr:hypothetical protein B0H19DRAFT_1180310 [Mycena capillaripes]